MTAVLKDDTELFKQFMDNESCRKWLTDTVFALTRSRSSSASGDAYRLIAFRSLQGHRRWLYPGVGRRALTGAVLSPRSYGPIGFRP
jgi:hypothetical protein